MAFDTQRAVRRLTDAGLDERAAEGVADVVASATNGLATEASLLELRAELREDMQSLRAELREDMQSLRAELKEEMQALRAEFKEEALALRAEMYRTMWIQGAGVIAAVVAILGLLTAFG